MDLNRLVLAESKTGELTALQACAGVLAEIGSRVLGPAARLTIVDTAEGQVVQWRIGRPPYRVGLVGHYDTVHPLGSLAEVPYVEDGDVVRGPGAFDMKGGLLAALYGARAAIRRGTAGGVLIHCCPDEEDGSRGSRPVLAQAVQDGLTAALVFEGAGPGGQIYTARKGGLWCTVTFEGRDAHASRPEEGVAVLPVLAEFIARLPALARARYGTTVIPTRVDAGTAINTMPGRAVLVIDCRAYSEAELQRVFDDLVGLPEAPGVTRRVAETFRFSPLSEDMSAGVFETIAASARELGLPAVERTTGLGISDANHLAGMGVRVVDGMGPIGGQDHSPEEWVSVRSIRERARLTAAVLPALLTWAKDRG